MPVHRLSALLVLLAALVAAAPAAAGVRPVEPVGASESLAGFDAAGTWQVALAEESSGAWRAVRSPDAGRAFAEVARGSGEEGMAPSGIGVDADGTVWLRREGYAPAIERIAAPGEPAPWHAFEDAVAVSLPLALDGAYAVAVVRPRADGADGYDLWLDRIAADGTRLASSPLTALDRYPGRVHLEVDRDGPVVLAGEHELRLDGSITRYRPDLGRADLELYEGVLYQRATEEVWLPTMEQPPAATPWSLAVPVPGGFVVWSGYIGSGWDGDRPVVIEDPAPRGDSPNLTADTRTMLGAANRLRAEQGLPALAGDALISTAARNHAKYNDRWQEGHGETRGREGFTGATPQARCEAVGVACGGEILFTGRTLRAAVRGWYATPLHRPIVGTPDSHVVGAASTGNSAVMNGTYGRGVDPLVVAPIGLPRGVWSGPRGFANERPDPGAGCGISEPYGLAVTAHPFTDVATGEDFEPTSVTLADSAGRSVPGCDRGTYFLPDDKLARREYRASATWTSPTGASVQRSWTFAPGGAAAGGCLKIARATVKARRAKLRLTSCEAGRAVVTVKRGRGRVGRRTVTLAAGRAVTVTVKLRRRGRGAPAAIVVKQGGHRAVARPR